MRGNDQNRLTNITIRIELINDKNVQFLHMINIENFILKASIYHIKIVD